MTEFLSHSHGVLSVNLNHRDCMILLPMAMCLALDTAMTDADVDCVLRPRISGNTSWTHVQDRGHREIRLPRVLDTGL